MDEITKPARTDVRPANGRSSSEWTLVAQRRSSRQEAQQVDARPARSGRSSSERTTRDPKEDARLARERTLAQLGHSSSELWTFVQRGQKVDARPARSGRSSSKDEKWTLVQRSIDTRPATDARPANVRSSPNEKSLKALLFKNAIQRQKPKEVWRGGDQRTLQSSSWVLPRWKITNFHRSIHALSLL
ncbi:hypothetical protein LR48_Vigan10g101900 [Vigna angularis]|uniref:Uncharacterized protein n=1 Tax=Phaseolus angularis TaxID=3914 RepID=A0A0L9VJP4_PHAAN|nr:hypothetical protein LR48_Vigan10g101900 [Vigna angularis]